MAKNDPSTREWEKHNIEPETQVPSRMLTLKVPTRSCLIYRYEVFLADEYSGNTTRVAYCSNYKVPKNEAWVNGMKAFSRKASSR